MSLFDDYRALASISRRKPRPIGLGDVLVDLSGTFYLVVFQAPLSVRLVNLGAAAIPGDYVANVGDTAYLTSSEAAALCAGSLANFSLVGRVKDVLRVALEDY